MKASVFSSPGGFQTLLQLSPSISLCPFEGVVLCNVIFLALADFSFLLLMLKQGYNFILVF